MGIVFEFSNAKTKAEKKKETKEEEKAKEKRKPCLQAKSFLQFAAFLRASLGRHFCLFLFFFVLLLFSDEENVVSARKVVTFVSQPFT